MGHTIQESYTFEERRRAVSSVQFGEAPSEVSRVMQIPERTLFRWLSWYRQGGWHALRDAPRSGAPRKVNGYVMLWLYEAVTQGDPRQHKLDFNLWTLKLMRTLLKRKFDIAISNSSMGRLMAQMGLSAQRPIYRCYKQDPAALEQYLGKTFPEIKAEAKRTGAVIYFVDEASVRSDSHRGTTWGNRGETPVVKDGGGRFGLRLISAVTPRGDLRYRVIEGRMNGEKFIEFIRHLRQDADRPIIVICDNARYHTSGKVKQFEKDCDGVTIETLPAYSPELNPDEQVWNQLKGRLRQCFIHSNENLKETCRSILRSIQKTPQLVRTFFKLPHTRYILETA